MTVGILSSFAYWSSAAEPLAVAAGKGFPILIDSGGFTAWTSGKPIHLPTYVSALKKLTYEPWGYFVLDVIGDPKATYGNEVAMRAEGLAPIPIFTRTTPLSDLKGMLDRSQTVGVGGMVKSKNPVGFAKLATSVAGKHRLHLLGRTGLPEIAHLQPRSVDCSSWSAGGRWNNIVVWLGNVTPKQVRPDALRRREPLPLPVERALTFYGIDRAVFMPRRTRRQSEELQKLSLRSYIAYGTTVQARYGVQFFLAANSRQEIQNIVASVEALQRGEWSCP